MALLEIADLDVGIRQLTINNPARRNALSPEFFEQLNLALENSAGVRVWLIRGTNGHFSAGFDLHALAEWQAGAALPDERMSDVLDALSTHRAPSVALVEGVAFGAGCELALACDFRMAATDARFCLPPAKIGVVYSQRGLSRVAQKVGLQQARTLFLTGDVIAGPAVEARGLVDAPLSVNAEAEALKLCRTLAANAPLALEGMKLGLQENRDVTRFEELRRRSFASADAREGRLATLEKRAATFTGQ